MSEQEGKPILPPLFSVLTSREAAEEWGLSDNTVTQWCNRGKFLPNEARKSGKVWLVTLEGMMRITGREAVRK
ncbi:helix-turn-helix protein [Paenibacillus cellulosilyticus]|uniref:Helix-turn-helix protein n=1 Tax=Paenibacillus cellulosilyticus TaxID=375489 RepID=A0A2V2YQN9_9BACL|nr:helix-turn-helix domain-containing protein [Paenibacillus cellulosilyticus]PWV92039.1 helix-turn-helix protein [Paenibacillus cellulosilyticus]QKS46721.1 helix-turn-helix domain-containing protein [Paenibacillus cellulosilyticus]